MLRAEKEIFQDLALLCASDGYAHVVAYLCFRDNAIRFDGELRAKDFKHQFSTERLVRTEINTLIGLMCKARISLEVPPPGKMQELIEKTEMLLKELHEALAQPMSLAALDVEAMKSGNANSFASGMAMREPIFYSGESAYDFQYRELALRKYASDGLWIEREKGFSLASAKKIIAAVLEMQDEKAMAALRAIPLLPPEQWTILPAYKVSSEDLAGRAGLSVGEVNLFLNAFAIKAGPACNTQFDSVNAFNGANAFPFIDLSGDGFLLFQRYSLSEAFYDTPFFWMCSDRTYINEAMKNRGRFLEAYSAERLRSVFGQTRVHENVDIWGTGQQKVGEIDVLVIFANRAIVLQGKSKRLTLESRKGNDYRLKDDFMKSVQASYNQGLACAKCLNDPQYAFRNAAGEQLAIKPAFKEIHIFCVVSDHYPALGFQARQFLKSEETEVIKPPFVMDVFLLDVLCEMLRSPLYLLSYVNRRIGYADRIFSSNELVVLSYHLKRNLWIDDATSFEWLGDDIAVDLDIAMTVRRTGIPGADTPDGILTELGASPVKTLLEQIEHVEEPATIDLGFLLLCLGGETLEGLGRSIGQMARKAKAQKKHHDLTIAVGDSGMSMHFNRDVGQVAAERLKRHCVNRKYACRAKSWFGVCINPENLKLRFGVEFVYPWEQSDAMDEVTERMSSGSKTLTDAASFSGKRKVGRNDPCICGSGKKFKKCCLGK